MNSPKSIINNIEMASNYNSTPETTYFAKAARCIMGPCTDILRDLLYREVQPADIKYLVRNHPDIKKDLSFHQRRKLYLENCPDPDYKKFDITLLYRLLRTPGVCNNIDPPSKGWGKPPSHPNQETIGDDLERIRLLKDEICSHLSYPAISYTKYCDIIRQLKSVCSRFDKKFPKKNYHKDVTNIEQMAMDPLQEEQYAELLKEVYGLKETVNGTIKRYDDVLLEQDRKINDLQKASKENEQELISSKKHLDSAIGQIQIPHEAIDDLQNTTERQEGELHSVKETLETQYNIIQSQSEQVQSLLDTTKRHEEKIKTVEEQAQYQTYEVYMEQDLLFVPGIQPAKQFTDCCMLRRVDEIKVKRNYSNFLLNCNPMDIFEKVFEEGIISKYVRDDIMGFMENRHKVDKILKSLLRSKPEKYEIFLEILRLSTRENNRQLADSLKNTTLDDRKEASEQCGERDSIICRLHCNLKRIEREVEAEEVLHLLLEEEVISPDEHDDLFSIYGTKIKNILEHVFIYVPWSYSVFLNALKMSEKHDNLLQQILKTIVTEEQIEKVKKMKGRQISFNIQGDVKIESVTVNTSSAKVMFIFPEHNSGRLYKNIVEGCNLGAADEEAASLHCSVNNIKKGSVVITLQAASPLFFMKLKSACESGEIKHFLQTILEIENKESQMLLQNATADIEIKVYYKANTFSKKVGKSMKPITANTVNECRNVLINKVEILDIENSLVKNRVVDKEILEGIVNERASEQTRMRRLIKCITEETKEDVTTKFIKALEDSGYHGVAKMLDGSYIKNLISRPDYQIRICILENYKMLVDGLDIDELRKSSLEFDEFARLLFDRPQGARRDKGHILMKGILEGSTEDLQIFIQALNNAGFGHILLKLEASCVSCDHDMLHKSGQFENIEEDACFIFKGTLKLTLEDDDNDEVSSASIRSTEDYNAAVTRIHQANYEQKTGESEDDNDEVSSASTRSTEDYNAAVTQKHQANYEQKTGELECDVKEEVSSASTRSTEDYNATMTQKNSDNAEQKTVKSEDDKDGVSSASTWSTEDYNAAVTRKHQANDEQKTVESEDDNDEVSSASTRSTEDYNAAVIQKRPAYDEQKTEDDNDEVSSASTRSTEDYNAAVIQKRPANDESEDDKDGVSSASTWSTEDYNAAVTQKHQANDEQKTGESGTTTQPTYQDSTHQEVNFEQVGVKMEDQEGDSDSEEDSVEYSGMEQPSLLKQLKTILAEYPDDGQILKELIQNAEDAEASQMKIFYDGRSVNAEDVNNKKRPYRKYFKGPALVIHNDAYFSSEDWKGIRMLYSSIKELDRTKVGRFGLGFKSVFHITDYPVIISGDKLLILDPHQKNPGKVCQTIKLKKLHKCRGMDVTDCLNALSGIFGFSQGTLNTGIYSGTLFRFPLRDIVTNLSDNIYDESKVTDLIRSFQTEAPVSLLFLKSLEKIELYITNTTFLKAPPDDKPMFVVSIAGENASQIREERKNFLRQIKAMDEKHPEQLISRQEVTIQTNFFVENSFSETEKPWLVYNLFKGESISEQLRILSTDESLGYSPYVGIAVPLSYDPEFKGHVFCFLPLPLESKSLTGLPVHVNGVLALSQNRRHVKWPTDDQVRNHSHKDKSIQWNECLISEVLSEGYTSVVEYLINKSTEYGNPDNLVSMVSRCIPDSKAVDFKWDILLQPVYRGLLRQPFLFTSNNGGQWIRHTEAVFAVFRTSAEDSSPVCLDLDVKETVINLVKLYNKNIVDVPTHLWNMIQAEAPSVQCITPLYIRSLLRSSSKYKQLAFNEKIYILKFILEDGEYSSLNRLKLLPLQKGGFTRFTKRRNTSNRIYSCSQDDVAMFPELEDRFVMVDLPQSVNDHIQNIVKQGLYQLYPFSSSDLVTLLQESIEKQFGTSSSPVNMPGGVNEIWLSKVWLYIKQHFPSSLSQFSNIPILPAVLHQGRSYSMYGLSGLFILKTYRGMSDLSDDVCTCLQHLSVIVIQSLPQYIIDHPMIMQSFVHYPNTEGVLSVLNELSNSIYLQQHISRFNEKCEDREKESFLNYLENYTSFSQNVRSILNELNLFHGSNTEFMVSASQVQLLAPSEKIPINYPRQLIVCVNSKQREIAKQLGVREFGITSLVHEILRHLTNQTLYSDIDKQTFMPYMMANINVFESNRNVIQTARSVAFVPTPDGIRHTPSDLYDHNDTVLTKLFPDGNKFPCEEYGSDAGLAFLKKLGLKSFKDLTPKDILESALQLHNRSEVGNLRRDEEQSKAIMKILQNKPQLLTQSLRNKQTLASALCDLKFVLAKDAPSDYPKIMNWYGSPLSFCAPSEMFQGTHYRLVGSVSPLLPDSLSEQLLENLHAKNPPSAIVIQQLDLVIEKYENCYKPELLPLIKDIYTYLAKSNHVDFGELKDKKCAWTGNGFCQPCTLYVTTSSSDISLEPYLYPLPSEFQAIPNIKSFFISLGSKDYQDIDALVNVQKLISDRHTLQVEIDKVHVRQDLQLVIKILNKLKKKSEAIRRSGKGTLFPIHTINEELVLKPAPQCRYSNADWLKDLSIDEGEEILFVHPDVPRETAVMLGVPSLTEDLLSDAEGFEEWGQKEPLTRRLKNILKDYNDGFSVPKEIVQNADDAGATKVCFLYDERENNDARVRLLDDKMGSCQGPALWAYNNATFTKKDLKNITKLSGATKEEDLQKIGKFGLGFCSVYNLTDVPSFITGNQIVIFDPHAKYLGKAVTKSNPGLKINMNSIKNQIMVKRLKNQFKPFNGIFGCDLSMKDGIQKFDGTLFRFPLRTANQAAESEISSKPYPRREMESLLNMFMSAAGNILLFTQNVTEIELHHLAPNGDGAEDTKLIYRVKRNTVGQISTSDSETSMDWLYSVSPEQISTFSVVKDFLAAVENVRKGKQKSVEKISLCTEVDISVEIKLEGKCLGQSPKIIQTKWLVAWASGTGASLDLMYQTQMKKALPLASVAALITKHDDKVKLLSLSDAPFGFYKESHLFCYLPLPVESPLPIHINGSFAVTSNRRQLCCKTIDDKESFENKWNEVLMSDAVCNAYLLLLESFKGLDFDSEKKYCEIWPVPKHKFAGNMLALQRSFYHKIVKENPIIFRRSNTWEPFDNCIFLDPSLMSSEVGNAVFNVAIHFTEMSSNCTVMELPLFLLPCFEVAGCIPSLRERILTTESFYKDIFFPNIGSEYWRDKEDTRDQIVYYALKHSTTNLSQLLKTTPCIPSKPNGTLKKPHELVHPLGSVKVLFSVEEERFIADCCKSIFQEDDVLKVLSSLGLIKDCLPDNILINRVHSVGELAKRCSQCGLERCKNILSYLSNHMDSPGGKTVLEKISNIKFLPVEKRPNNWIFPWGGDNAENVQDLQNLCKNSKHNASNIPVAFEKPTVMYNSRSRNLVGCMKTVFDRTVLYDINAYSTNRLPSKLGIKDATNNDIPTSVVIEQLLCICHIEISNLDSESQSLLADICKSIYKYFDSMLARVKENEREQLISKLNKLKELPVILLNGRFVKPDVVALRLPVDCSPCLYGINTDSLRHRKHLLHLLDVKDVFQAKDLLHVLLSHQNKFKDVSLQTNDLDLFCTLLEVLAKALKDESLSPKDLKKMSNNSLLVPDENCILKPIDDLCMDDSSKIRKSRTMTFAHEKISLDIAKVLGIKSKQRGQLKDHSRKLPFGQKEELTTRLTRLLSGYPCNEGILKELLQNADDAGASEIHFVKDYRNHPSNRVFDEQWMPLQGPALLVYNDSAFTEADIEGIQKLGIGSKGDDPTKTGQYGVGFNAVYHLTDAPSFLTKGSEVQTGETLCVLDPHCHYISDATEESPGIQYVELDKLRETYHDVFHCYHEEKLLLEKGTIFRFPLRNSSMAEKSNITKNIITKETVNSLLDNFKEEMFQALLFVKNVRKITISDITTEDLNEEYQVEVRMSEEDQIKRNEFAEYVKNVSVGLSETHNLLGVEEREISYTVNIKDRKGSSQAWIVVQRIGLKRSEDGIPESVKQAYHDGEIGMLPIGGVALPLPSSSYIRKTKFTAFCFLPLPLVTGLPVLVNGHFDLDHETRRSLWHNDKEDKRTLWNKTLIRNVITPAYVKAVQLFKKALALEDGGIVLASKLKAELDKYHAVFPNFENTSEEYWKFLVSSFYRQIIKDEEDVFVSCSVKKDESQKYSVSFHPLFDARHRFPAVFDDLLEQLSTKSSPAHLSNEMVVRKANILRETCKVLGMKLLDSPIGLLKNLTAAGIPDASFITPEYLLEFLKSFNNADIVDRCCLQGLNEMINKTSFRDKKNVFECIFYCQKAESFHTQMEGLPLCLTNDDVLHVFTNATPVFCTEYCSLLPISRSSFLHKEIVPFLPLQCVKGNAVFKPFDIDAFVHYLPDTLSPEKFKTQTLPVVWQPDEEPNTYWVKTLWRFLYKETDRSIEKIKNEGEKSVKLLQLLYVLSGWCLIPCVRSETRCLIFSSSSRHLLPISCIGQILLKSTFSGNLAVALQKMSFPDLDQTILDRNEYDLLARLIACQGKPLQVLQCLCLHQEELYKMNNLETYDCYSVLEYLAENFNEILEDAKNSDKIKDQIRSLPLHVTFQNKRTDLVNQWNFLLLQAGMPSAGIEKWGESSSTLLLRNNEKLRPLYDLLEFAESSLCAVYSNHIFRTFHFLSNADQIIHLEFVRDRLLSRSLEYSTEQTRLINALKSLPFIAGENGGTLKASEFCSPYNGVFEVMRNYLLFPPKPFCDHKWELFMELAGMKKSVMPDMFIFLAEQVEKEGFRSDTASKSKKLVEHLFSRDDLATFDLQHISRIRFVIPHKVSKFYQRVHKQFNTDKLICFSDSVISVHHKLTWTNCDLLPPWANPFNHGLNKTTKCQLNASDSPYVEVVLQHIQNICDSMKDKMDHDRDHFSGGQVQSLMKELYKYLQSHAMENEEVKQKLKHRLEQKPIIYLPVYHKFIASNKAVKELDDFDIIEPYLYPLPDEFVPYFKLFEFLGTNRKAACENYARVLEDMYIKIGATEMHDNELKMASRAICKLFQSLQKALNQERKIDLKVNVLYFPSRQHILIDSSKMIYSDLTSMEEIVQNEHDIVFFVGFTEIAIPFRKGGQTIEMLPEKYRPKILSQLIEFSVNTTALEYVDGEEGRQLEEFIQSPEFIENILRLIYYENNQMDQYQVGKRAKIEIDEKKILSELQSISVRQVVALERTSCFRGTVVGKENISSHFDTVQIGTNKEWIFYFSVDTDDWIQRIDNKFAHMLDRCTGYLLGSSKSYIFKILNNMNRPKRIRKLLDDDQIDEYSMTGTSKASVFAIPGTIVHPKWHFLLDNSFTDFHMGESVALQLADEDSLDEKEPGQVFMYAVVKKKIQTVGDFPVGISSLLQLYVIDVGSGQWKEMSSYKIYKFNRNSATGSRELKPAEHISYNCPPSSMPSPRPLQDYFMEIRQILKSIWARSEIEKKLIIKRLLRKWHPDKNYGDEEFAKQVFPYIKHCMERLERGEDIDNENRTDGSPGTSSNTAYEAWFDDVEMSCGRDRYHQQQSTQQQSTSNTSSRHYRDFYGYTSRTEPTPLPQEARRWYRQACNDLAAAQKFVETAGNVGAYNWICYKCHQAAEKAMKAVWYYRDANYVTKSHELSRIARGLEQEIQQLALSLDSLLGNHSHMLYPDLHQMPIIPSDMFDANISAHAIEITQKLCETVSSNLW